MRPLRPCLVLLLSACAASGAPASGPGDRTARRSDPRPPPAVRYDDSLLPYSASEARLRPVARIADDRIGESSGLAYAAGTYWTHNDSGGGPALYYAPTPDFADARRFELPGALAVDWEELATDGGDVLACDVGDNFRLRDDLALYRVRPGDAAGAPPRLVATYPVAYEDGPHDAEAVAFVDGRPYVLIKDRGEGEHGLYTCDPLVPGARNVLARVGALRLPAGEQATAMDVHPGRRLLAVLTYSQVAFFALDALDGDGEGEGEGLDGPPVRTVTLHARQCEALCFVGDALVFGNEQRDVYRVEDVLERPESLWLPARKSLVLKEVPLPRSGAVSAFPQMELLPELPLADLAPGEFLRFGLAGDRFIFDGRFRLEGEAFPTAPDSPRPGTAVIVALARERRLRIGPGDVQLAFVADAAGRVRLRAYDLGTGAAPDLGSSGMTWSGRLEPPVFEFRASVAVERIFPGGLPDRFLLNVAGNGLRTGDDEPVLGGFDYWSLLRPYVYAEVRVPGGR